MTAVDLDLRLLAGAEIHALLGQGDGGGGTDGGLKGDGHAVGDAAVDAAGVVGLGDHLAVPHLEGVVGLAAPHEGEGHPGAEVHPLDGGDGEEVLGEDALHVAAEVGGPQPGGQAEHGALHGAAHAVLLILGLQDGLPHLLPLGVIQHGEGLGGHGPQGLLVLQGGIRNAIDGADVGTHPHAMPSQHLLGHRTGGHQRGGEAAGEVAAPPVVLAPLAPDKARVVPVAGAGGVADGLVVLGVLVGVADHHGQGGAGGLALKQAGEHLHQIALLPGGCRGVLAGPAAVQLPLHRLQLQLQPGGHPLHHHADGRAVGLAENHVSHTGFLPGTRPCLNLTQ